MNQDETKRQLEERRKDLKKTIKRMRERQEEIKQLVDFHRLVKKTRIDEKWN